MTTGRAPATATVARLHELLDAAVKLELSTIPPYLCALYSIRAGTNVAASMIIRSVVVEEMLHMVLAADVLNAVGGRPAVSGPDNAPRYPHELPVGVVLDLQPFSPRAVEGFLAVENPEYRAEAEQAAQAAQAGRRPTVHASPALQRAAAPSSIGAFYDEIVAALDAAVAEVGEAALFTGDPARQVGPEYYYASGGRALTVRDVVTAKAALAEIVDQGEGRMRTVQDAEGDLAHYYRFRQLKVGRAYRSGDSLDEPTGPDMGVDYTAVFPMVTNPRLDELDDGLRAVAATANRHWSRLLTQVDASFDGSPARLVDAVQTMFRLRDAMLVLLANPLPGQPDRHAGPTFEWDPTVTGAAR